MSKVVVYTLSNCPYCVTAKRLLDKKGASYQDINISKDVSKMDEMLARSNGRRSVPQIFIGDYHVGGSDDLHALDKEGKLDALLAGV